MMMHAGYAFGGAAPMNKIIDGLYLGNLEAASNYATLKKNSITHILTVAVGIQPVRPQDFTCKKIEILDAPTEDIQKHFSAAVEFIKTCIDNGGIVLVHCYAGVSRSTSCVMAYLIKEKGMSFWDAYTFTRGKRPIICPNVGFMRQIQAYEVAIKKETILAKPIVDVLSNSIANPEEIKIKESIPSKNDAYICSHCKTKLFMTHDLLQHETSKIVAEKGKIQTAGLPAYKIESNGTPTYRIDSNGTPAQSGGCEYQLYIKQMDWIYNVSGKHIGQITCPNKQCSVKIGAYSYCGLKCNCGKSFTPGFLVHSDRVIIQTKKIEDTNEDNKGKRIK